MCRYTMYTFVFAQNLQIVVDMAVTVIHCQIRGLLCVVVQLIYIIVFENTSVHNYLLEGYL